jgi:hypothetical protein
MRWYIRVHGLRLLGLIRISSISTSFKLTLLHLLHPSSSIFLQFSPSTSTAKMMETLPTNQTLLENPELCTLETCPLSMASVEYRPVLWGNILFMAIFGAGALIHLGLGIRYKTWTFMVAMVLGLIGEVVGYVGRVNLYDNPFNGDAFLEYVPLYPKTARPTN